MSNLGQQERLSGKLFSCPCRRQTDDLWAVCAANMRQRRGKYATNIRQLRGKYAANIRQRQICGKIDTDDDQARQI